ncbi:RNB domain-containing ribonuclease [Methanospirillum stamsii]|uniref:Ribonuclease II n=1 Tax=Methanospirillum stamsii TaxID=1277351 RepID=A0A2V2MN86_9EURY|nr:RNB domain-containing ribonuclease [Methanospirillum stamsii]PWR69542.1 ribonuclease II [Methanospirillum stamsii]
MKKKYVDLKTIAWDAMERYGFIPRFPHDVIHETGRLVPEHHIHSRKGIKDLRNLLWSSIDNPDSEDLDQIEYASPGENGDIHIKIAISDVDYYVTKDSSIDRHANHNGTSVYPGVITFHMLPDRLCKGISSLLPGEDRHAIITEYDVHPDGSVKHGEIYRAIVRNKAKLVYEEIGDWLESKIPVPQFIKETPGLEGQIRLQNEAAVRLRAFRRKKGALDLETLEAQVVSDGETVTDLVIQKQNPARCLIEEFMVAANGTMVFFLENADLPMIHRVVRVPKYWEEIRMVAAKYGTKLSEHPDAKGLSTFLTKQHEADPERFPDLSLTIVKLMGSGEYVPFIPGKVPIGHFALAVTDYTHGTAPNRRYVDLIIQRLIKSVLLGTKSPYRVSELNDKAEWLSGREKAANKVERFMRKSAAALLLKPRIGDTFSGFITGASEKGTYVRLISPPAEGRVMKRESGLHVGQKVVVRLMKADPINGHIDFEFLNLEK